MARKEEDTSARRTTQVFSLPLLVLLLSRLPLACTFSTPTSSSAIGINHGDVLKTLNNAATIPLIDRVPTFRFYQGGLCQLQVSGRGGLAECRARLHVAISTLLNNKTSSKQNEREEILHEENGVSQRCLVAGIVEIESLQMLEGILEKQRVQQSSTAQSVLSGSNLNDDVLLVNFYGRSCKQYAELGPLYDTLPFVYRDKSLRFGRADVTNFPTLVVPPPPPQNFASLDRSQNIEDRLEGCPRCGGGGFVVCTECNGQGHLIRSVGGHTVADVCMTCVGQTKIPCPQCGGKCYLC